MFGSLGSAPTAVWGATSFKPWRSRRGRGDPRVSSSHCDALAAVPVWGPATQWPQLRTGGSPGGGGVCREAGLRVQCSLLSPQACGSPCPPRHSHTPRSPRSLRACQSPPTIGPAPRKRGPLVCTPWPAPPPTEARSLPALLRKARLWGHVPFLKPPRRGGHLLPPARAAGVVAPHPLSQTCAPRCSLTLCSRLALSRPLWAAEKGRGLWIFVY